ncbi:MAG: phage virion morphogenesis protein [Kiritimatiellae bacterium]|nr:phage virion morphogenesis protein [Kiritimatiellia bacterium]
MITITVDTSKFDRMMADFPVRLAAAKKRALEAIGQAVASRATQAFRSPSLRPSPWAPRKPSKRDDGHPLLIRSGNMRQSIRWELRGADTVAIGTPTKYAPFHQHGTKNMPARPFFPIDRHGQLVPAMASKVARTVERIYTEELGKLGEG